jgi:hypothetical protein
MQLEGRSHACQRICLDITRGPCSQLTSHPHTSTSSHEALLPAKLPYASSVLPWPVTLAIADPQAQRFRWYRVLTSSITNASAHFFFGVSTQLLPLKSADLLGIMYLINSERLPHTSRSSVTVLCVFTVSPIKGDSPDGPRQATGNAPSSSQVTVNNQLVAQSIISLSVDHWVQAHYTFPNSLHNLPTPCNVAPPAVLDNILCPCDSLLAGRCREHRNHDRESHAHPSHGCLLRFHPHQHYVCWS